MKNLIQMGISTVLDRLRIPVGGFALAVVCFATSLGAMCAQPAAADELTFPTANCFEGMCTKLTYINSTNGVVIVPNPGELGPPFMIEPHSVLVIPNFGGCGGHIETIKAPPEPVDVYVEVTDDKFNPMRISALTWFTGDEQAQLYDLMTPDGQRTNLFIASDGVANLVVTWYGLVPDADGNLTDLTVKKLGTVDVSLAKNVAIVSAPKYVTRATVDRKVISGPAARYTVVGYHDGFRVVVQPAPSSFQFVVP
jgi:hypothetical protein